MKNTTLFALAAATAATLVSADTASLTVWDGETAARGGGWASPHADDKDKNFIKPQTATAHGGETALELRLEGGAWLGGGWNWHAWWPGDAGTDTTGFTHLVFWAKAAGGAVENFTVHLTGSGNNKNSSEPVRVAEHAKGVDLHDGEWHKIQIPLADFLSKEDKPFDRKTVWEITFGTWSQNERAFSLFIDDIGFVKIETPIGW